MWVLYCLRYSVRHSPVSCIPTIYECDRNLVKQGNNSLEAEMNEFLAILLSISHDLSNEENVVNSCPASISLRPLDQ
jgi:hypothetical protein